MSTLYVKVSIARRPNSGKPRAIRVQASYNPKATSINAEWYAELSFTSLKDGVSLNNVVKRLSTEARAQDIEIDIKRDVLKQMEA